MESRTEHRTVSGGFGLEIVHLNETVGGKDAPNLDRVRYQFERVAGSVGDGLDGSVQSVW
jgi:hypothetical protein